MMGLLTGHRLVNRRLFNLGLLDIPSYDRCKQAFATSSLVICDLEALVVRFGHMDLYFLNLGDFADLSIRKVLYFIQSVGLLNN